MRIVATNAHKNPIVFECPWLFAENEEIQCILSYDERSKSGERIDIGIPRWKEDAKWPEEEPGAIFSVGMELNDDNQLVFFADLSSDATESTERVFEQVIEEREDD